MIRCPHSKPQASHVSPFPLIHVPEEMVQAALPLRPCFLETQTRICLKHCLVISLLNCKSHDIACCENVSLSNVRSYSSDVSRRRLPKHERNKDDINRHAEVDRGEPVRPQPYTKSYRQSRNTKNIVFSREEHTSWLSNSNCFM